MHDSPETLIKKQKLSRDISFPSPLWWENPLLSLSGDKEEEEEEKEAEAEAEEEDEEAVTAPLRRSVLNYSYSSCLTAAGILKEPQD